MKYRLVSFNEMSGSSYWELDTDNPAKFFDLCTSFRFGKLWVSLTSSREYIVKYFKVGDLVELGTMTYRISEFLSNNIAVFEVI